MLAREWERRRALACGAKADGDDSMSVDGYDIYRGAPVCLL